MADIETNLNGKYLMYKGRPLVREGNQICYGSMQDPYVMYMMILAMKKVKVGQTETDVPGRVIVQILKTDTTLPPPARIVKQFIVGSLYEAFSDCMNYYEGLLD